MTALLLLAFACSPGTIELDEGGEDADNGGGDDSGADSGDTGGDDAGDTAGDSGDSGDSGGGDTEEPPPEPITYVGDLDAEIVYGSDRWEETYTCHGEFELTVDVDGSVEGWASCAIDEWGGYGVEGDIAGEVDRGDFTGVWTYSWSNWEMEADLAGLADGSRLEAEVTDEVRSDYGDIVVEGLMDGAAQ